jgi:hypothetical protein
LRIHGKKDIDGNPIFKKFEVSELSVEAQSEYHRILNKIKAASTGITISPIDVIIKKLKDAGYSVDRFKNQHCKNYKMAYCYLSGYF